MTIVDQPPRASRPDSGDPGRPQPQDIGAEISVLGAMLLSTDAIADVVEILKTGDFYRPAHARVFDVVVDLYGRGEPADAITVAAALRMTGDLAVIGGAPYLHTLISSVPTAANAGYYARIVADCAELRRIIDAGTRVVQMGYAGRQHAEDNISDRVTQVVYQALSVNESTAEASTSEILRETFEQIERTAAGEGRGLPIGLRDFDELTGGLQPGQLVLVAGRPGVGKALALDTPLPTPSGWTTMGDIRVGDLLIGADGQPTRVTAATNVMYGRPCYEVRFSDGEVVVADAEHLWRTSTRASRRQRSEGKRSLYWSQEALQRVAAAYSEALAEPDRPTTQRDVLAAVGQEFQHILHTVGRDLPSAGRLPREVTRRGRVRMWNAPAYSRRGLLRGLFKRSRLPMNAATTAIHQEIVTTAQIAATLRNEADGRPNHAVAVAAELTLPGADLAADPYVLGAWLGDGHSWGGGFTSADPEIIMAIEGAGYQATHSKGYAYYIRGLSSQLRALGVLRNKHIPAPYLRASAPQRRAILEQLGVRFAVVESDIDELEHGPGEEVAGGGHQADGVVLNGEAARPGRQRGPGDQPQ